MLETRVTGVDQWFSAPASQTLQDTELMAEGKNLGL